MVLNAPKSNGIPTELSNGTEKIQRNSRKCQPNFNLRAVRGFDGQNPTELKKISKVPSNGTKPRG
jgi:hypothetical protein